MLAAMPEKIYLTFDIDFFDPSLVPATGTPEPGGGHWYPTLRLLRHLFQTKTVVAMDLIELAPCRRPPGERLPGGEADLQVPGVSVGEGRRGSRT